MTAEILTCTVAEYHADPCPTPSLSSSIAKVLIERSPLHAHHLHPRFGKGYRAPTESMRTGTLIHRLLLNAGAEIVVINEDSWRKKAAKLARSEAEAAGKIAVLKGKHARAADAVAEIADRLADCEIHFDGQSEVPIRWQSDLNGIPVECRCMLDHVDLDRGLIYDVKVVASASPDRIARSVIDYGYDIQGAAYTEAVSQIRPNLAGRVRFVLLFVEAEKPYAVCPVELDGTLRAYGSERWGSAVEIWHRCLERDEWPGYASKIETLEPPPWLASRLLEGEL